MREFKFRAWDKRRRKMMPVTDMNFYENLESPKVWASVCGDVDCGLCEEDYEEEDVVIMQYTGLTDKNGREIYEGDIIVYEGLHKRQGINDSMLIVEWDVPNACFTFGGIRTDYAVRYGEVIGNTYENREVLEDEE